MDPDIVRIFGDESAIHMLPKQLTWSPDSQKVAYLRTPPQTTNSAESELWMYDLGRNVALPLMAGKKTRVSEYTWVDKTRIAAIENGDIWLIPLNGEQQQLTNTRNRESDVKASPDGAKLAYIRDHNIYLLDLITMIEYSITKEGNEEHTFGEVTWLYEEEFETDAGFGWSPNSDRLWYYETDLSKVSFRAIPLSSGNIKAIPYPRPGEPNPVLSINVIDVSSPDSAPLNLIQGGERDVYLPEVSWHPDGDHLIITELDRLQTTLSLFVCTVSQKKCTRMLRENDPSYVDLLDGPVFLSGRNELLRLSEATGYAHIYRVRLDTFAASALTRGQFEVSSVNYIDEKRDKVIFTANPEDTGEHKLYAVSLSGGDVMTIPQEAGNHDVKYAPNGAYYVDTHSALNRPPRTDIKNSNGDVIATIAETFLPRELAEGISNEIFPIDTPDGVPIMAHLTRPTQLEPDTKYPVLIIVYGGPHAQLAQNAFHPTYQPWRQLLAKRGILVFTVDGRGSAGRGHLFESAIQGHLGKLELKDQLVGIAHLRSLPFVDPNRVGVFGWSYGGYMALNAVLRTKKIFNMSIAVAPVTDWRDYDTAYTERYMRRPEDNPEGYKKTALIPLASHLSTPLLLIHGIADDNVQLIHSHKLFDAFTNAGKFVTPLFYPGKDHQIAGSTTRIHLFTQITRFIEDHL